jgi:glutathione S-transferase
MLKLYGFSKVNAVARGHTRDLRVLWALEEMQLPFELAGMDHPAHDLNTEAYRRLSPFEQIPSIDDDGLCCPNPPPSSSTWRRSPAA